ncbi:OmpP1/FadL family transporter [Ferrimonas senticii]|uniref:OmpP1/FadL family transporter n=1 Tax=Ferrimonas senticii TaxID=394566 RepID=UPI0003F5F6B6|nr:outer membrane protein transport protein [Ferrimonas senticii]
MKTISRVAIACAVALSTGQAFAAGFQLNSQSATGIGRAFAGDAVIADNASVLSRNPAAMAMFDAPAMSIGMSYVDIQVDVLDARYNNNIPALGYEMGSIDDAAEAKVIPNAYYIHPINDKFAVGTGIFSNFGTGTDTSSFRKPDDKFVFPSDLIGNTEVTTITWNLSGSYRVNEHLSFGAGVDVVYGEGVLTRENQAPNELVPSEMLVDVDASGIGFGGIVGVTYEFNENHRIGASYRFSPDMDVDGTVEGLDKTDLQYKAFDELTVPLADIAQIAGYHRVHDNVALHYTVQWTQWSNFDSVDYDTGTALKDYQWQDSLFTSVGATWYYNDFTTLRAGFALDEGVVDELSSASIPDSDRKWYSIGASFKVSEKGTVDLGFAHIAGKKVLVEEDSLSGLNGSLTAHTKSTGNYFSIQYSRQF